MKNHWLKRRNEQTAKRVTVELEIDGTLFRCELEHEIEKGRFVFTSEKVAFKDYVCLTLSFGQILSDVKVHFNKDFYYLFQYSKVIGLGFGKKVTLILNPLARHWNRNYLNCSN